jgi:fructose-bisphosphate aldolase, class II
MLVSMRPLLHHALQNQYAVGSFNVANFEMMETVIQVAAERRSPVIVSTSSAEARYFGPFVAAALARALAKKHNASFTLHLDHGDSFELAMICIQAGYSSVMFDGSHHPLDENIRLTKEVVRAAHAVEVSVEGEVGRIGGVEDNLTVSEADAALTKVEDAIDFAQSTGVDALAIAIGNAHGFYTAEPRLDFSRLKEIRNRTRLPIVLHGGTGIPPEQIKKAIQLGIAKINIASKVRRAFMRATHQALQRTPNTTEVREVFVEGKNAMAAEIRTSMNLFGSSGMREMI